MNGSHSTIAKSPAPVHEEARYVNKEDHYSISYPYSQDIYIWHPNYATAVTRIAWQDSTSASVDIHEMDSAGLDLLAWLKHEGLKAGGAEKITVRGVQFIIVFNSEAHVVTAYGQSVEPGPDPIYELDFSSGSPEVIYPAFWRDMFNSFRLESPTEYDCQADACAQG